MNQAFRVAVVVVAFVGIFLAGAITGGVVTAHFVLQRQMRLEQARDRLIQTVATLRVQLQKQQASPPQGPRPIIRRLPSPGQFGPQLMQRFVNQIQPTPEERQRIQPLVDQTAETLRRLRRDTVYRTEVALEHLEDQIAAVLNPDQRNRFDEMVQRWRDAFQRFNYLQQQRQAEQRLLEQRRWREQHAWHGPPSAGPMAPAPAGH